MRPALATAAIAGYITTVLWIERGVSYAEQLGFGVLTWIVLIAILVRLPGDRRAQTLGVVAFATVGEVTGSLIWGVYSYRLHNLPLFIPPGHGLVYLAGLSLSRTTLARRHTRALVVLAGTSATVWCLLGLSVLPRRDVAGAFGVPLLLAFLWRSPNRSIYAGVYLVVAALELYGTAIGTWRWAAELPGTGIPDGNPPSGVASGYVWFDVMAMVSAPWLYKAATSRPVAAIRWRRSSGASTSTAEPSGISSV